MNRDNNNDVAIDFDDKTTFEHLTDEDVQRIVNRLRREAAADHKHAERLEAWWAAKEAQQK